MASKATGYDVIVIGAGVEGSASAYSLVKQGKKVLLLEQFPLPHTRGSSHGQSRVTRYAYEDEFYVQMMVDAFPLWAQLEKEVDSSLFVNCGVVDLRKQGSEGSKQVSRSLKAFNIPHEILSAEQMRKKFPVFKLEDDDIAVWDPSGGLLKADKCLRAFQTVFQQLGGVIHDGEPVTSLVPGDEVTVTTSRAVYKAPNVVIAAGAWTGRFCSSLGLEVPLQPVRILVLYWQVKDKANEHSAEKFPAFIDSREEGLGKLHAYGLPMAEYPALVKVCCHEGADCDPAQRDKITDDAWVEDRARKTVASTFPYLETKPSIREYCIYTNTPDNHPYIDKHPKYPNIVIAGGFSGHGFKLAPAVGKAVSELVLNKQPSYPMTSFKLDRFSPKAKI